MPRYLLPGENLVVTVHRHWILLARSLLLPALLVAAVLAFTAAVSLPGEVRLLVTLAGLAVAGLWMIVEWVRWSSTSLTVTDHRVVLESGILSRESKVIPLDRIQDVSTRQSLAGRLFGYGTVEIDAAGPTGSEPLDHVPDPDQLRDQVFAVSETLRRTAAT
ncbi:PH domain-containing protein [Candidatus Nephthysia bennettiae]|uniref:PH domain-containing protein n=1 Tax=Candidatus Nephthysia bennettiae TaxID=3127016 RepID=A0A934K6S8_9BACT|nr:PH domain-containing protein [Candidatus Dormibacteraeota bacterium]